MAGMTGYDQTANYQAASVAASVAATAVLSQQQYHPGVASGYIHSHQTSSSGASPGSAGTPTTCSASTVTDPLNCSTSSSTDPQTIRHQQLHQQHWHHHQYQPSQHLAQPTRYGQYYDRNGYYHQHPVESQNWHEPVTGEASTANASGNGTGSNGTSNRTESPVPQHSYNAPSHPSQYGSCKLANAGPPSPTQKQENPQQYQQFQCPISQYNNNLSSPSSTHHATVHNSYSSGSEVGVSQESPSIPASSGGGTTTAEPISGPTPQPNNQSSGNNIGSAAAPASQGPLPSPLYPWMRSQFGKSLFG